jgi:branched-chain amino acid transport system permease protein
MTLYLVSLLMYGGLYAILGLGLNLQFGLTGFVNLGFVAFFAVGAYASALLTTHGMPIALGPLVGLCLAAAAAYPIGLIVLRLEDDYLAIVTFGFAQVVQAIIINSPSLGGADGLTNIGEWFAHINAGLQPYLQLAIVLATALALLLLMQRLTHSPYGRVLRAIRNDPVAARSLGKEAGSFRLAALVIGSGFAGAAGSLYAHYIGYISPDQFDSSLGFLVFTGIVLGGSSNWGAAAGTLIFVGFSESTRFLTDLNLPVTDPQLAQVRLILIGVALILVMRFRREGLWPYRYRLRARPDEGGQSPVSFPTQDVAGQATQ